MVLPACRQIGEIRVLRGKSALIGCVYDEQHAPAIGREIAGLATGGLDGNLVQVHGRSVDDEKSPGFCIGAVAILGQSDNKLTALPHSALHTNMAFVSLNQFFYQS